jgi:hypothetical protein
METPKIRKHHAGMSQASRTSPGRMIILNRPGPVDKNHPQGQEKQNHPHAEKYHKNNCCN